MRSLKFAIHTLGCKVNSYESQVTSERLVSYGFKEVPPHEKADIYIINTCTVTNMADRKTLKMARRSRALNKDALIVAMGCFVDDAIKNKELSSLINDGVIDLAITNKDKDRVLEIILDKLSEGPGRPGEESGKLDERLKSEPDSFKSFFSRSELFPQNKAPGPGQGFLLSRLDGHTRAFIKVQDGCDMFCSYCIIPYVRGRVRIRPLEETIAEIKKLSQGGVTEVVLDGIHLSSMGEELLYLLSEIEKIDGIKRVRLGSLEPGFINEKRASSLSLLSKLCPHFHLSLQSGSDKILKLMNRRYSVSDYEESCELLRKYFTHPAITTDIIVGFPEETDEDFEETFKFVSWVGFSRVHVFKFSPRRGTPAFYMDGQIDETVKKRRSQRLRKLSKRLSRDFAAYYIGKKISFISEEMVSFSDETYETGYSPEYVRCMKRSGVLRQNELIDGIGQKILDDGRMIIN